MTITPASISRPAHQVTSSPLPPRPDGDGGDGGTTTDGTTDGHQKPLPPSRPAFDLPKLRLEVRDLSHPGAGPFLAAVNPASCLAKASQDVLRLLYASPGCPTTTLPPTRSVTLVLRDMPGVAYTTGSDLDPDHKEVHFSLGYIANISPPERRAHEVTGVITHELVHCFQRNGFGTCPGGLVEGIADWVRLNCDLSPPHWKRSADGKWDAGYQTTAYFLQYLEERFGEGTVRRMNEKLRIQRYQENTFWSELVGEPVDQLWKRYGEKLKDTGEV